MQGTNPKRAPTQGSGELLEVKNIFKTIQGEGPFVGMPAVFIRLGGCNLACEFCDTDFEDFQTYTITEIIDRARALVSNSPEQQVVKLIVITGGEPLRQPIELLCRTLLELGFTVQIETNGTLYRPLPEEVHIICSPKAGNNGYSPIREDLLPHIKAFKFLISPDIAGYSSVPEIGQSKYNIPVFVQPIDQHNHELNTRNAGFATQLAIKHGYRLSLQIHKVLGIE